MARHPFWKEIGVMWRRTLILAGLVVVTAVVPTRAQSGHLEASVFGGWTFSDGVTLSNSIVAGDGNVYNRIDPKDSGNFGFSIGVMATPNAEVGFIYGKQFSTLVAGGTTNHDVGTMGVSTYHGYFGYNFGEADAKLRPFFLGGFGATTFGDVNATVAGVPRNIAGESQFSTTWSAGVKYYASPHFAIRAAARWTPTYIKTDSVGWWCDPYWGCYLVGNPQYSNQMELNGGVTFKF
jgi:outer membrane protein W